MAFVLRSVHISAFVFILGYNCLAFWGFLWRKVTTKK